MSFNIDSHFRKLLLESVILPDRESIPKFYESLSFFVGTLSNLFDKTAKFSKPDKDLAFKRAVEWSKKTPRFAAVKVSPPTSRYFVCIIYAVRVLGKSFSNREQVKAFLDERIQSPVYDEKCMAKCLEHAQISEQILNVTGNKRKREDDTLELMKKRRKLAGDISVSPPPSAEEEDGDVFISELPTNNEPIPIAATRPQRATQPPVRFEPQEKPDDDDDASSSSSVEELDLPPASTAKSSKSTKAKKSTSHTSIKSLKDVPIAEGIAICINFLYENNAKLFISNNKLSSVKIGPEKVESNHAIKVVIEIESDSSSESESESDAEDAKKGKKRTKSKKSNKSKSAAKKSPTKSKESKSNTTNDKKKKGEKSKEEPQVLLDGKSVVLVSTLSRRYFDSKLFDEVTTKMASGERLTTVISLPDSPLPLIPEHFVNCWNNNLEGISPDEILSSCATTSKDSVVTRRHLRIAKNMQLFVIGTLFDEFQSQIKQDLEQACSKSMKIPETLVNESLLNKLESMAAYNNMVAAGTFPRDFSANVADRKTTFRRFKSEVLTYVSLCKLIPAVIFTDVSFSAVVRLCGDLKRLETDWEQLRSSALPSDLPTNYFSQWAMKKN